MLVNCAAYHHGRKVADLIRQPPKFVYADCTVRQAAEHMVRHGVGRLPVVSRESPPRVVGIMTRSDVLSCFQRDIEEEQREPPTITLPRPASRPTGSVARR